MTTMFVCLNYGFSFHPPWCNLSRRGLLQRCWSHVHWHNLSVCRMLAVIITEKGVHARNEYDLLKSSIVFQNASISCKHPELQTSRIAMNFVQIDLHIQDHSRISLKQSPKTRVALWAGAHELHRHTIFRNYSHTQHVWYSTPIVNAQHHWAGKLWLNVVPQILPLEVTCWAAVSSESLCM